THIIRGEEWIPSVPLHVVMIDALGFTRPTKIHMPLLRNADKSKVSKRRNPTSLLWYRDAGIIPEGMLNFLGLMGFSLGEDTEVFSFSDFVAAFKPEKIALGGPVFDLRKLEWCNGEHMRRLEDADLLKRLLSHFETTKIAGSAPLDAQEALIREDANILWPDHADFSKQEYSQKFRVQTLLRNRAILEHADTWLAGHAVIERLIPLLKTRLHTLSEAADYLPPFFEELPALPLADLAEIKKFEKAEQVAALEAAKAVIEAQDFAAEGADASMEAALREMVEAKGWKVGPVFMSLRLAALRAKISPPLFESMLVIGKDWTLKRVSDAIAQLGA
ncbi:MAG: hypothetical protein KDB07_05150, partial [Planctomycetes bacterium]|nr:hypothetical protein [Planctomycetota bacterium]